MLGFMMRADGAYGDMMGGGFSLFHTLFAVVILADLVLLGLWLWKNVKK